MTPIVGKMCKLGLWDESIPGIEFDENGVSNYAKMFQTLERAYPRGDAGKKEWENIVNKIKEEGKKKRYDCIIGISGGTDSSYLLHIAKEYKLRPLAVNIDNGYNSDIAMKNIEIMTKQLNMKYESYSINQQEINDLFRSYLLSCLPWIDMPSDIAIKSVLYKIAKREGVKYILRGNDFRSEGSQPKEWTYGDGKQLRAIHNKYGRVQLKTYLNLTLLSLFDYVVINKIKNIYPFYYIEYNKNKAQTFLKERYGWEYYGGHHYENIFTKFVLKYWLYEKFGIDKRKITYSAQIMSGEITKEYALEQISKKPYNEEEFEEMMNYVLKKLDITPKEFDKVMSAPNKSYRDYPSYNYLLTKIFKYGKPFLRFGLINKPQSLYQAEMRNYKL